MIQSYFFSKMDSIDLVKFFKNFKTRLHFALKKGISLWTSFPMNHLHIKSHIYRFLRNPSASNKTHQRPPNRGRRLHTTHRNENTSLFFFFSGVVVVAFFFSEKDASLALPLRPAIVHRLRLHPLQRGPGLHLRSTAPSPPDLTSSRAANRWVDSSLHLLI